MKIERLIAMVLVVVMLIPRVGVRAELVKCEECGKSIYIEEESEMTTGEIIMGIYKTNREKEEPERVEVEIEESEVGESEEKDIKDKDKELTKGEKLGVVLVIVILVIFYGYLENYAKEQEQKEQIEQIEEIKEKSEQEVGWLY